MINIFKNKCLNIIKRIKNVVSIAEHQVIYNEEVKALSAKLLVADLINKQGVQSFKDVEFSVYSQWGDDGIIQWLTNKLEIKNKTFIEFGVEDYRESNTRFLMMNDNWSGLVLDGDEENIYKIKKSYYYWKFDITAKSVFVDAENINSIILSAGLSGDVGLLHIDIDGNDYWVWKAIDIIDPVIVVVEYNSVFGYENAVTVPYRKDFNRTQAHYSNLYAGASLRALHILGSEKGYAFVGCNSAGNNAYFVKKEKLNSFVKEVSLQDGYVLSKFRESRGEDGELTFVSGCDRIKAVTGLPVFNVMTGNTDVL